MKKLKTSFLAAAMSISVFAQQPVDYVNTFIGSANFGTTNPGAVCPVGMMSVVPFNVMGSDENKYDKDARWWSTPYTSENCFFTGYAHTSLSGVGCPDMASLLLMPTTGELNVKYKEYGSKYKDEVSTPGYYSNVLTKYNIKTEVSATKRTGISRFTFPAGQANVLLNLGEGLTNETGASVRFISDTEIEGTKLFGTFCYTRQAVFPVYFAMRINKKPASSGYWKMQRPMTGVEAEWDQDNGKYKIYTSPTAINYGVIGGSVAMFSKCTTFKQFFKSMYKVQLFAFTTASSMATLPLNMKTTIEELHVSKETTSFALPLGATINMNGNAAYYAMAAIFFAQMFGIELTITQYIAIIFTSTVGAVGQAGVPGPTLLVVAVLMSANIPIEALPILFGVDRIFDMLRTAVNITGDAACATIVDRFRE